MLASLFQAKDQSVRINEQRTGNGAQQGLIWHCQPFLKIKRSGDSRIMHLYKKNAIIDRK